MGKFRIMMGAKFLVFGALFIFVASGVTMYAWNYVIPHIFHGSGIRGVTYWQALALIVLSRLLFWRGGGWHKGGEHHGWRRHMNSPYVKEMMEKRWAKMSPEQRERAKKYWEYKCGGWGKTDDKKTPEPENTENAGPV